MIAKTITAALLLTINIGTAISCPAHSKETKKDETKTASQSATRTLVINFGQNVFVKKSKFRLIRKDQEDVTLSFDNKKTTSDTITVFLPEEVKGKFKISWTLENLTKEILEGSLNLDQES